MKGSRFGFLVFAFACALPAHASTEYTLIKADPKADIAYTNPAWSPDGKSIAYVRMGSHGSALDLVNNRGKTIYLATMGNGEWHHKLLLRDANWPVWSPDGKSLAFARNGVAMLTLRTGKVRQLTRDRIPQSDRDEALATTDYPVSFSPNGRYVAYYKQMWEENQTRVFDLLQNRDAGIFKGLHETDPRYAKYARYKWFLGNYFDWSPDSRHVLSAFNWFMDQGVPTRLVMADLERRKWDAVLQNYRVTGVVWPHSHPESVWLVLEDTLVEGPKTDLKPPQGPGIYRLDLNTRRLVKLASIHEWIFPTRDFKRFAFASRTGSGAHSANLYVGETNKWQFRLLSTEADDPWDWHVRTKFINWSPDGKSLAYVTKQGDIRIVKFQ